MWSAEKSRNDRKNEYFRSENNATTFITKRELKMDRRKELFWLLSAEQAFTKFFWKKKDEKMREIVCVE